jgi:hypothetical protein
MNTQDIWNVNGFTRDHRALRVTDTKGDLVALVTIPDNGGEDAETEALKNAALISCAAPFRKLADAVLRWSDKQDAKHKLPRPLQRRLISTVMKSNARI